MPETVVWAPQPGPQHAFVTCPLFEVVFGGARGGGKTDAALGDWAIHAARYGAHATGMFVRRTRVALEPTIDRAKQIYGPLGARWQEQKSRFQFPNGALIYFRYLDRDDDADNYQGHSYTWLGVEELTQFPLPGPVNKLKATLRSAHGVPVKFRATCNPGGPGHTWVKARYIDPGPWTVVDEGGLKRVFIPAKLQDNRFLGPEYVAALRQSGSDALVRAWLDGDWNVVEGAFFDVREGWNLCRPFTVPQHWTRFRAFDWGSAKPFSTGWYAVAGERITSGGVVIPRGALVRYREWYGADKPNHGLRMTVDMVAKGIVRRSENEPYVGCVCDPAMFAEDGGPSRAEIMAQNGVYFRPADNARVARGGRMGGWDEMRRRLEGHPDEGAMLVVFDTCRHWIRTVPALTHDRIRPEDIDTESEDHAADETRYACMSRPILGSPAPDSRPKPRDRWNKIDPDEGNWKVV